MIKKAIVVGATSGIGKGVAQILVKKGYKVGIAGRRENLLEELESESPKAYVAKVMDVTDYENAVSILNELTEELGGLDVLIVSAATIQYNPVLNFTEEKLTIDTNINGFTCIMDWGFNYFRNQGSGHLVGITSVAGFRGWRNNPAYNASKSYQMNYLEGLRNLAKHNKLPIYVTDARPGYVETAMKGKTLVFWVSSVEKASKGIYRAIRWKFKVVYVSGRWRFGAWLYKKLPNNLVERA